MMDNISQPTSEKEPGEGDPKYEPVQQKKGPKPQADDPNSTFNQESASLKENEIKLATDTPTDDEIEASNYYGQMADNIPPSYRKKLLERYNKEMG